MKTEDFNIKFKEKIISGEAKVTLDGYPIRIICWNRKGKYPNIGLIDYSKLGHGEGETIIEFDNSGYAHIPNVVCVHGKLRVEYDPIGISKRARVVYSLLQCPCIEKYMRKYGYKENEEKGWYWNAVEFANKYAKAFTNELHKDLKENKEWKYDDDYDW